MPTAVPELGRRRYNAALRDFVDNVVEPAARRTAFDVRTTTERQSLEDWLPAATSDALRRFSATANRGTGSSHPSDRRRWFAFLLAARREGAALDAELLVRWLIEEEGWSDGQAHRLGGEYEFGLSLLDAYGPGRD